MNADEWPGFSISDQESPPPMVKPFFLVFFSMKMNITVPFSEFLDVAATFPFVARVLCLESHFKNLREFRESSHYHKTRQKKKQKSCSVVSALTPQLSVCTPSRFLDSVSGHTNATLPLPSPFHASTFPAPRRCPAYLLLHRSSTEVNQLHKMQFS